MILAVYANVLTAILRYAVPGLSLWLFARCAREKGSLARSAKSLFLLTVLQGLLALSYYLRNPEMTLLLGFAGIAACQWLLLFLYKLQKRNAFETEILCFFLSTFGMCAIAAVCPEEWDKQLSALVLGVLFFLFLGWIVRDEKRIRVFCPVSAVTGAVLLLITLFFGETYYGAKCWLRVGGVSIQPAEISKICFLFAGATREEDKGIFPFVIYAVAVCLCLVLMNDFGTAVIFFFAFLIIAFLRSGSVATVLLSLTGLALTGGGMLRLAPHAFSRFATWRHIWQASLTGGYQQTRALMCIASGGLLGLGAGKGWMKNLFAADSDMVIATVSEEWGLLTVTVLIFCVLAIALRANRKNSIAVAAAAVLVFQTALNTLGTVDILPLTGVTFPFLSNGGTSMLCAWGLFALIQEGET